MERKSPRPLLRGWSHLIMFFVALIGCGFLISESDGTREAIATSVYSFGALTLFGISSIYHRVFWKNPRNRKIMGRLDHSAIYLMIAGGFTPVCMLVLPEKSGNQLLLMIWIIAFIGIIKSLFLTIPKWLSSLIYVLLGFMALPYLSDLIKLLDRNIIILLIGGGASYCIGATCYALKRPRLIQHIFGYHEVFHMFVNIGAILHFLMIYFIVIR